MICRGTMLNQSAQRPFMRLVASLKAWPKTQLCTMLSFRSTLELLSHDEPKIRGPCARPAMVRY